MASFHQTAQRLAATYSRVSGELRMIRVKIEYQVDMAPGVVREKALALALTLPKIKAIKVLRDTEVSPETGEPLPLVFAKALIDDALASWARKVACPHDGCHLMLDVDYDPCGERVVTCPEHGLRYVD